MIDQGMRTITGINTHQRSPEGWVPLPVLVSALEEGQRVALELDGECYIVGHTVYLGARWWLVPDWRTDATSLHRYEES